MFSYKRKLFKNKNSYILCNVSDNACITKKAANSRTINLFTAIFIPYVNDYEKMLFNENCFWMKTSYVIF